MTSVIISTFPLIIMTSYIIFFSYAAEMGFQYMTSMTFHYFIQVRRITMYYQICSICMCNKFLHKASNGTAACSLLLLLHNII